MFRIAIQGIISGKLRTLLLAVSLCLSIVSIVTVTSASSSVSNAVRARSLFAGGPVATYSIQGFAGATGALHAALWDTYLASIADSERVAELAQLDGVRLSASGEALDASVTFVDDKYASIHELPMLAGTWFGQREYPSRSVSVILNDSASVKLNRRVGDTVTLRTGSQSSTVSGYVIGIVQDGAPGEDCYVAIGSARDYLAENSLSTSYSLQFSSKSLRLPDVLARIRTLEMVSTDSTNLHVSRVDTLQELSNELGSVSQGFVIVGILSLLVGMLAVTISGLSAVRQRRDVFILRRVLGARRWHAPVITLLEGLLVSIPASIAAVLLSRVLYPWIVGAMGSPFGEAPPTYSWGTVWFGVACGLVSAIVGGACPAIAALGNERVRVTRA
ncbi:ABC transporter permease [Humibacter ginsenosidimutans]|uniref:ABC transporter permease n=1 Tax=Humibacter ginsenosidimutans TaxID=2599293 RepID=A0A5B8M8Z7_9MICO|nr:ABC transporter permease [Humibacter ginsenosidimutans]